MSLGFHSHPEGMRENSPTFQGWGRGVESGLVPKGRLNARTISVVPSGLIFYRARYPKVETLVITHKLFMYHLISLILPSST